MCRAVLSTLTPGQQWPTSLLAGLGLGARAPGTRAGLVILGSEWSICDTGRQTPEDEDMKKNPRAPRSPSLAPRQQARARG